MSDEELASAEVKRAVVEVRTALSAMAQREALAYPLMGICALIDRVEVGVTAEDGADAFVLDEENSKVSFRVAAISQVLEETHRFAGEVGYSDAPERLRLAQKAVNQFVVHELTLRRWRRGCWARTPRRSSAKLRSACWWRVSPAPIGVGPDRQGDQHHIAPEN